MLACNIAKNHLPSAFGGLCRKSSVPELLSFIFNIIRIWIWTAVYISHYFPIPFGAGVYRLSPAALSIKGAVRFVFKTY